MTRQKRSGLLGAALAILSVGAAVAQVTPQVPPTVDPAQLQRQREALELQRQQAAPKPVDPKLTAPAAERPAGSEAPGPSFILKRVEFTPSKFLTEAELQAVVAGQMGKPTTFADVKRLAIEINALYLARGHLTARAFVPSQRVAEGNLKVQLIEAQLSAVVMPPKTRLSKDFLEAVIATPVGSLIDGPAISERLTRLHRGTPDNRIALDFAASESRQAGLSVIKIDTEEPPRWTAKLAASNEGADSLGKNQLSANVALNNLLGRTDKLSLLLIGSKGSVSANVQYGLPLPGPFLAWGTRFNVGLSHGKTQTVSPGFESVKLDGASSGANLGLSQPLWRRGVWSLDGGLSLGLTQSATDIQKERFSDIHTRSLGLTATLGRQTEDSTASVGLALNQAHTSTQGDTSRNTFVTQLNASLQQVIGAGFWLNSRAVIQRTGALQLPSTLQFQAGGPGTVRGYPSPAASGDQGETLSLELHRPLTQWSERIDAFVFVDAGRVSTKGAVASKLASAGLGGSYAGDRWQLAVNVAAPRKALPQIPKDSTRLTLRLSADLEKFL